MRKLLYILLLFGSIVQAQFSPMAGVIASQGGSSGQNYSLANATYQGTFNPTPSMKSIEVANGKAFLSWSGVINEFTIVNPTDVTSWTDDSNGGTGYLSSIGDFRWDPDGDNLALTQTDKRLFNYVITTSFDPTARSTRTEIDFSTQIGSAIRGFYSKPDGTKLYLGDQTGNTVYQYTMSTPGVCTSATYDSKSLTINALTDYIAGVCISPDGKYLLILDPDDDEITVYTMSTPWDISTGTQDTGQTLDISSYVGLGYSLRYNVDGNSILIADYIAEDVTQFDLNN